MRQGFTFVFIALFPFMIFAQDDVTITGSVKSPEGEPLSNATISIEERNFSVQTDSEGNYSFKLQPGNYTIVVEAVGYELRAETLSTRNKSNVQHDFFLLPKHLKFEEVVVTAEDSGAGVSVSSPTTVVNPEAVEKSSSVLSAVTSVAGVAPLGQGGLFQVPSIRGAARERTILMLESIRVTSERRTGPSFSFADPLLFERISVTRGPAPVLYGSNGETGLIQGTLLEPSATEFTGEFQTGYQTNINENWQAFNAKSGTDRFQYVIGAARREGGDFESGDGQEFSSGYMRINVMAKGRLFTDSGILTFLAMPSWTNDIEKASSDAATRPTLYPEERHQTYTVDWQNGLSPRGVSYQLQGWYHPNSLITQDEQLSDGAVTSRDVVFNDTDDYGIRFRIGKTFQENWTLWTGVDHFGRTDINAKQESFLPSTTGAGFDLVNSFYSIQNGSYLDTGIFLTGNGRFGRLINNAGVRVQRVSTENNAGQTVSDSENSWSANYGASYPLSESWDAVFNVGRGIRPATISEKFFTGATGRGAITGNPNLVTESNLEFDGGLRYHWENGSAAMYVFHNDIEDFIARVRLEDGSFTYFNLSEVRIYGVEGEGYFRWNEFRFYGNFHDITGNDGLDANVNDIPPSRVIAGIEYEPGKRWGALFEIVRQFEKNDPGPDELTRDSAFLINLRGDIAVHDNLTFRISGLNLTNETYFDSADNRAPLAIGRNVGFELLANF